MSLMSQAGQVFGGRRPWSDINQSSSWQHWQTSCDIDTCTLFVSAYVAAIDRVALTAKSWPPTNSSSHDSMRSIQMKARRGLMALAGRSSWHRATGACGSASSAGTAVAFKCAGVTLTVGGASTMFFPVQQRQWFNQCANQFPSSRPARSQVPTRSPRRPTELPDPCFLRWSGQVTRISTASATNGHADRVRHPSPRSSS